MLGRTNICMLMLYTAEVSLLDIYIIMATVGVVLYIIYSAITHSNYRLMETCNCLLVRCAFSCHAYNSILYRVQCMSQK